MNFKLFFNNNEYGYLVIFIFVVFLFSLFLVFLTRLFSESSNELFFKDKLSPYECGFIPYDDARAKFEVHFYIVALLFVIFDVELILLLP
jgi:NADH-quinone oxidoreductase subunit A